MKIAMREYYAEASIFTWADSGEPITGNPQPKRSNASSEKHCKCHGGSPNTPVGGYCYNLPGYGTKPACTKKSELPPSIYKLALDIAQGKTRSWNATSAVRLTASAARRIEALCPFRRAPDTHVGGCQRAGSALLTTSS
mmetsp:Transcript_23776/g.80312  ORF Transcript_23776/g.80312 Transcript_23776/m.80312 type:complete len:139 (-) Transcript_23776:280-696(-)